MRTHRVPRWQVAGFFMIILLLVGSGIWFYVHQMRTLRVAAESDLNSVSEFKVSEIAAWREDQLGEGGEISSSGFFVAGAADWMSDPNSDATHILERFKALRDHYGYSDVLLVDPSGTVRLTLTGDLGPLQEEPAAALIEALRERRSILTDLYQDARDARPTISVVAPLFAGEAPIGAVLMENDASRQLFSLIRFWPTPSASAEALLVERDGSDVLFLNDLRFRAGTALVLRIPLSETDVPAVMAVLGRTGIVRGKDYRGVDVISSLRPVPDSSWFLVTKMDAKEALAAWSWRSVLILSLIVGLFLAVAAAAAIVWQREEMGHYRRLLSANEALRVSLEQYHRTLDSMFEGCQIIDFDWRYAYVNEAGAAHGRRTRDELIGHTMMEVYPGIESTPLFATLRRSMEDRTAIHMENEFKYPDGTRAFFDLSIQPVEDGLFILSVETTERKLAEAVLRESEEHYRSLFENMLNGYAFCRMHFENDRPSDFTYLSVNAAFEAQTGLRNVTGKKASEAIPGIRETDPELFEIYGRVARTGRPEKFETYVKALDMWFEVSVYSPEKEHFVAVFDVITERKLAEQEIRKLNAELEDRVRARTSELEIANRELEAFSYSVSHDLRAPLRGIDGYTRILTEEYAPQLDAEGRRICEVIRNGATTMGRLIDDLLTFSRLRHAEMQRSRVDMKIMADSIFHEVTTPADRERIDFRVGPIPPANGDPTLLRQVWANLLSNAVKFSSRHERAIIEVEGEVRAHEVVYSVKDDGSGFDMRYAGQLFGVFHRLHSAREFEGNGVGLAIVQQIVHRHGGRVWAKGEPEKGATFGFALPMEGE